MFGRLALFLITSLACTADSHAQPDNIATAPDTTMRGSFFIVGFGCPDLFAVGHGWQIRNDLAIGIKVNTILTGGGFFPVGANGGGVRGAWYFHPTGYDYFFGLNAVSLEASYNGYARGIEAAIGHEAVLGEDWGLHWGLGIGCVFQSHRGPNWLPTVKIGISQNL